jgi:uncharacterized membrane protein
MGRIWRGLHLLNPVGLFVVIALGFGVYFAYAIPPLWGVDEYTHFDRAFQLSKGVLVAHHVNREGYGGSLPANVVELNQMIHLDLADNKPAPSVFGRKDVDSVQAYRKLTGQKLSKHYIDFPFNGAVVYSPVAYLPSIAGILVGRATHSSLHRIILLARLCTLVFYVAVIAFAILISRSPEAKWLIFAIALLPMALFQASIVNADAVVIALALLEFASVLALLADSRQPRWLWWVAAVPTVLLPLVKPNYGVISVLVVLLIFFRSRMGLWLRAGLATLLLVAITVPTLIWSIVSKASVTATAGILPAVVGHVESASQLKGIFIAPQNLAIALGLSLIKNQDAYLNSVIGALGWNFIVVPGTVVALLCAVLWVVALGAKNAVPKGWALIFLGAGLLGVASIFLSLYLVFSPLHGHIIYGVQGRYFLPLLPFLLLGLARFVPIKVGFSSRAASWLFPGLAVLALGVAAAYYTIGTY